MLMTIQDLINAFSTVGFPIAACIILFYESHKNNERREDELKELRKILSENTDTLRELVEYIKSK